MNGTHKHVGNMRAVAAAWLKLKEASRITAVRSARDHAAMVRLLDQLVDEVGDDEGHPLAGLLEVVGQLVDRYEAQNVVPPATAPREALRYLMDEHGLTQADLREDLGSQGVVSEILSGKRQINARQAKALAARFGVSAAAFL